jgi:hypothetical protein
MNRIYADEMDKDKDERTYFIEVIYDGDWQCV